MSLQNFRALGDTNKVQSRQQPPLNLTFITEIGARGCAHRMNLESTDSTGHFQLQINPKNFLQENFDRRDKKNTDNLPA
jgi:hypothetical protein